jgi:hypothetical protein
VTASVARAAGLQSRLSSRLFGAELAAGPGPSSRLRNRAIRALSRIPDTIDSEPFILMVEILPSILAADFARLGDQIALVEKAGASMIHYEK